MKTVIHAMGMHSEKYGGLELYMVNVVRNLSECHGYHSILTYSSMPVVEQYIKDIEAAGGEIVIFEQGGFSDMYKRFTAIVQKYNPQVVHAHFLPRIPMLVCKMQGIKRRYVTVHSLLESATGEVLQSKAEMPFKSRVFIRLFDTIPRRYFAVSEQVNNQLRAILPRKTDIVTHYLGVAENQYNRSTARELIGIDDNKLLLCNISFDLRAKAIDVLLEAIAILKHKYLLPDFTLMHYGIDPSSDSGVKWAKVCADKGIADCVKWNGRVNNILQLLPAMDIYLHPSRAEAIGLVIMEAGAAAVPVVASNIGGMQEVVENNISGLLFQVNDANQMTQQIISLINNKYLRQKMGEAALKIVREKFNINKQASQMEKLWI